MLSRDDFSHLREESFKRVVESEKAVERQFKEARLRVGLAVALLVVGFLLVAQWRGAVDVSRALEAETDQDLAVLIQELTVANDELQAETRRLEEGVAEAERTEAGEAELLNDAARELQGLRVLTGVEAAIGPGVVLRISDPDGSLLAQDYVNVVHELRAAGAEAISVGGQRVGAFSGFETVEGEIRLDGVRLTEDTVVYAIGDPEALEQAVSMPGGLIVTITAIPGVDLLVVESEELRVPEALIPDMETVEASD